MTTIFSITSHKWAIGQLTTRYTEIVRGADWKQVDRRRGLNNWQRARASIVHNSLVERARPCPPLPATTNIIGSSHTQHIYSQQSTRDCASVCSLLLWLFFFSAKVCSSVRTCDCMTGSEKCVKVALKPRYQQSAPYQIAICSRRCWLWHLHERWIYWLKQKHPPTAFALWYMQIYAHIT